MKIYALLKLRLVYLNMKSGLSIKSIKLGNGFFEKSAHCEFKYYRKKHLK